ncbi:MAG: chalcone isomerase family protein [Burkholderiales bacterium]|nr:chalcone isomerase family protein [Burkholderiales bacterium]
MRLIFYNALFFYSFLSSLAVGAAEVEGVKLTDRIRVAESGPELVLNGAGVRTRFVFRVYVGALYLKQKMAAAPEVLNDAGPKRVAMHLLRDLSSDQLLSALNDGLKNNHTPEQLAALEAQIKQLESIFGAVKAAKAGDVILIDYIPDTGTRIMVNGEAKGTIRGADFNTALLRVWLGANPADADLKKAMLGGG